MIHIELHHSDAAIKIVPDSIEGVYCLEVKLGRDKFIYIRRVTIRWLAEMIVNGILPYENKVKI